MSRLHWNAKTYYPALKTIVPNIGKMLGRGMFSAVYEDLNDESKVYKITSDQNQRDLYRDFDVDGFLPKYYGRVDDESLTAKTFSRNKWNLRGSVRSKTVGLDILHLERLYPVRTPKYVVKFYNEFMNEFMSREWASNNFSGVNTQIQCNTMYEFLEAGRVPKELVSGFECLNGHFVGNYNNCYDFAPSNWMQTKDGELRCSDPVYNNDIMTEIRGR